MAHDLDSTLLHLTRQRLFHDFPGQIEACLDALDDEQLWWRPNEQANAVGNLVLHLSGSNRYYFEQMIGGRDICRNRAAEFAARGGHSRAAVQQTWTDAKRATENILNVLQPSQLAQTVEWDGKPVTYAHILLHVTHHNAAHMGQIVWITKMLCPGVLDELWMKMRSR